MHNSSNNHFSGLHAGAEHRQTHDVGAQDRMPTAHPHRGGIHKRAVILQVSKQVVEFQTTPHLIKMKGGMGRKVQVVECFMEGLQGCSES